MPYADPQKRNAARRAWALRHPERCAEYALAYDAANREKRREAARVYRRSNPRGVAAAQRKSRLKTQYGLTLEAFDSLLVGQSGRCAICLDPMRVPSVDHDHATGAVRGLLCSECNTGLGKFRDTPWLLVRGATYLEEHTDA